MGRGHYSPAHCLHRPSHVASRLAEQAGQEITRQATGPEGLQGERSPREGLFQRVKR